MGLQIIVLREYVLSLEEFRIKSSERRRLNQEPNNKKTFERDLESGILNRYIRTYVAYKEGILCGQSCDEDLLKREVHYHLCVPNVDIFKVEKEEKNSK